MAVNFFDPNTQQQIDPQQLMAMQLMRQGAQSPQGQNVNGRFVPPQASQYAAQLANALGGAYKMDQYRDGQRAQNLLNGGTGEQAANGFSKLGGWLGGMFGGGA